MASLYSRRFFVHPIPPRVLLDLFLGHQPMAQPFVDEETHLCTYVRSSCPRHAPFTSTFHAHTHSNSISVYNPDLCMHITLKLSISHTSSLRVFIRTQNHPQPRPFFFRNLSKTLLNPMLSNVPLFCLCVVVCRVVLRVLCQSILNRLSYCLLLALSIIASNYSHFFASCFYSQLFS